MKQVFPHLHTMLSKILDLVEKIAAKADIPGFDWVKFLGYVLVGHFIFESLVDMRQYRVLDANYIPPEVKDFVDQETFDKTRAYDRAKMRFKGAHRLWGVLVSLATYHYGILPSIWAFSQKLVHRVGFKYLSGEITVSVVFASTWSLLAVVLDVPWGYYHKFVLEERFGFNKQTPRLFFADLAKEQCVSLVIIGVLVAGLGRIVAIFGNAFFIYASLLVVGFILAFTVLQPTVIDPLFNSYEPLQDGELKTEIDKLAGRLQFPLTRIYVQDSSKRSSHSNAYFIGLPWYKQIVLFDTLIQQCQVDQIIAILGHELGHWKLNHIFKHLVLNTGVIFSVFTVFAAFIHNKSFYAALGFNTQPWIVAFVVFSDIMTPFEAPLQFLISAIIRKHEYDADEFSANLGYGRPLAAGLKIMQKENLATINADKLYATYHFSHPILPERLRALNVYTKTHEEKCK